LRSGWRRENGATLAVDRNWLAVSGGLLPQAQGYCQRCREQQGSTQVVGDGEGERQ
jgi:hypothetical protein